MIKAAHLAELFRIRRVLTICTRRGDTQDIRSHFRNRKDLKCPNLQAAALRSVPSMSDTVKELNELFATPPATEVEPDVLVELQSILRLHFIEPQELSYKWEAHAIRMGVDSSKMDLPTIRAFKKDLQESLERDARGKSHTKSVDKRGAFATPRTGKSNNVMGMYVK